MNATTLARTLRRSALVLPLALGFVASAAAAADADKLARGKYLVTTSGCNDCHTPWKMGPKGPEPDMSRMLSGHPESMQLPPPPKPEGPWIVSAAAVLLAWVIASRRLSLPSLASTTSERVLTVSIATGWPPK